jgi:S1-C subfamily serine protease
MNRSRSRTLRVLASLSALALVGMPAGLAAQDDGEVRVFSFTAGRPRIGVTLDSRADTDRDRLGARIEAVSPDGPADKAGLKAGDIVTRFNGTALGGLKGDDEDESGPAQKLVELARKLEPGDTVEVEYRRDGNAKKTSIVAEDLSPRRMARGFRMEMPEPPRWHVAPEMPDMPGMLEGGPGNLQLLFERGPRGLALATLNPELGAYFGAKEGVLVLETPRDSTLPLKAGDVIVAIDGRSPTSEAHARRILGSYDGGETAKLDILRKQKKLTVSWKVPEGERKWQNRERRLKLKVERS